MRPSPQRNARRALGGLAAVLLVLLCGVSGSEALATATPTIETVAGSLPSGLPATSISLRPSGMTFDAAGNLYVSDIAENAVYRISPEGVETLVAGNGSPCLHTTEECRDGNGDGGPATSASLNQPAGLALDAAGDLFIAEWHGNVIRKVDHTTGTISTVVGDAEWNFSNDIGDGGPAAAASIVSPSQIAFDARGDLYISDWGHQRIRRVDPQGTITTVAGCGDQGAGCPGLPDDGQEAESTFMDFGTAFALSQVDGRMYIATESGVFAVEAGSNILQRIAGKAFQHSTSPGQGEGGPASDALFGNVTNLAVAPDGDLYIFDAGWNRIDEIDAPVTPASTLRHIAGCTCKGVDSRQNGFSGDDGPATDAAMAATDDLCCPLRGGIAVAPNGNIAFSDLRNNRVREIDATTGTIRTIAGNGSGFTNHRLGVYDFDFLYFDFINADRPGSLTGGFSGDDRLASDAQFASPYDLTFDHLGNLYVLDRDNSRVRRISPDGSITTVAGTACGIEYGSCPNSASRPPTGPVGDGGPATAATLWHPQAIALDRTGTQLYIVDAGQRIRQVNMGKRLFTVYPLSANPIQIAPGTIATVVGPSATTAAPNSPLYRGVPFGPAPQASFPNPTGIAADSSGNLYIADAQLGIVARVDASTSMVAPFLGVPHSSNCVADAAQADTGLPASATRLCGPTMLAISPDERSLYVSETGTQGLGESLALAQLNRTVVSRVRVVDLADPVHRTTLVAGSGAVGFAGDGQAAVTAQLAYPHGIAVGPDGSVYIADTGNARIRRVAPDGRISTVAGTGSNVNTWDIAGCGAAGDEGPAVEAQLCAPMGIAFGPDGKLYVADELNNRIRAIVGL